LKEIKKDKNYFKNVILLCALIALLIIFFASSLVEQFSALTFKFFSF
jgi:hypothetical protein